MRTLILSFLLWLAAILPAKAQHSDIEAVITSQIDAFLVDDFTTAFTFAHPNIQNIFRTPDNFGRMVRQGYPMVWRPKDVTFRGLRQENGRTYQDVQVSDSNGRVFLLEYSMTQTPDGWRISGVRILQASTLST